MTDHATNAAPPRIRAGHQPSIEYRIYWAVIFLISLPWAVVAWALSVDGRGGEGEARGPIARAKRQASVIAPLIFSA